jgi:type I phosphodiesterase/nucleotide pyrophosphatase
MTRTGFRVFAMLATLGLAGVVVAAQPAGANEGRARHVLLISVDGLHNTDLAWYVRKHPDSALGRLVGGGVSYTSAQTPFPSDSFPGMVAQVTGGNPKSTGIFYDDTFNHALLPAGTTNCAGVAPGVEVTYFEQLDKNPLALDAGQGLSGLPDSILQMKGNARSLIDPTQLPVDPKTCTPVYPDQYLKVNTIFEVARAAGLRTAWSDKHVAYEILGGKTQGIQDLFAPEINSNASVVDGQDWTKDNAATQYYDSFKVQAVINEINGFDHSGTHDVGTPAIFGMNFQTVSTAEKLPTGGYQADGVTPNGLLEGALNYVDEKVGAMQAALRHRGIADSTTIILSAKHGQSPDTPSALTRINDGTIQDAINAAWRAAGHNSDLVAFAVNDDGWLMWTTDRSAAATTFAKSFLAGYNGNGTGSDGKAKATDIQGNARAYTSAGLQPDKIFAGADAAAFMGIAAGDPRVPDVIGVAQYGTVYTGGKGKIAEHGGDNPQDRDVALVVSGAGVEDGRTVSSPVETTQIAPTILQLLGLDPKSLQSVQIEGTKVLPNL